MAAATAPAQPAGRDDENLHPLAERVRHTRTFTAGYLNSLDVDAVFARWDADESGHAAFNAIIKAVGDQVDPEIQEIRDRVFEQIFTATQHHELSAYVCEEIGLIVHCRRLQHDDPWLQEREALYLAGTLPYASPAFRAPPERSRS